MPKISIISDLHFGFGSNTEREEDPFISGKEAFETAKDSDLIILPGDIFDSKIPRPEVWAKGMKILSTVKASSEKNCEVIELRNKAKEDISPQNLKGIPIVAIHGTHERRGENLINPVEGLEYAGFLIHLHCSSILLEINGERIGVYGMSGVPEKYAKEVMLEWDPQPFENAYNIFMLHQSIEPYIYSPNNPPSLKLEDLPNGFDLYISGHIHWKEKTEVNGKPFLIPGSTITTQINKLESKNKKGFWKINKEKEIEFVTLKTPRKAYHREIELKGETLFKIENKLEKEIEKILEKKHDKAPLIRLNLTGKLSKGLEINDVDLNKIVKNYRDKAIIKLGKKLESEEINKKTKILRDIRNEKISVEEIGMHILRDNMEEMESKFNYEDIFQFLVEGNVDSAFNSLLKKDIKDYEKASKTDQTKKGGEGLGKWLK